MLSRVKRRLHDHQESGHDSSHYWACQTIARHAQLLFLHIYLPPIILGTAGECHKNKIRFISENNVICILFLNHSQLFFKTVTIGGFFLSFCVRVSNLRPCHLRLTFGRSPSMQSHSRLCIPSSQHRCLNAIDQKKDLPHSLAITRDTRDEDRELGLGQPVQYSNRWTEPQLNLRSH